MIRTENWNSRTEIISSKYFSLSNTNPSFYCIRICEIFEEARNFAVGEQARLYVEIDDLQADLRESKARETEATAIFFYKQENLKLRKEKDAIIKKLEEDYEGIRKLYDIECANVIYYKNTEEKVMKSKKAAETTVEERDAEIN